MITKLQYSSSENNSIVVSLDDGGSFFVAWPCETYHRSQIEDAISNGVVIEPFKTEQQLSIEDLEAQIKVVEASRDANLISGLLLNGILYHSDDRFLSELMLLLQGYQLGVFPIDFTQNIRSKDNTIQVLTKDQIVQLTLSIGQYRQSVYQASWAQKDALRSQIDAILNPPPPPEP